MKLLPHCIAICWAILLCTYHLFGQDGPTLYRTSCASCHDAGGERVPSRKALKAMSPEGVLSAMESGPMISMAARLSAPERRAVAEFVTEKPFGKALEMTPSPQAMCSDAPAKFGDPMSGPNWNGWGVNPSNTRYQETAAAGIAVGDVPRLRLKWAFGFPGDVSESAQPTIVGGRVFVGSQSGIVYSLAAATGCVHWWFKAASRVRTAISVGQISTESGAHCAAFFGDSGGVVYAVDAATGGLLWKIRVDSHPAARITGAPAFYDKRLHVPVASLEEVTGASPDYQCCTFRGSVVAIDAAIGKQIWKTYTISEEPHPTKKNRSGIQMWGPSGAGVWSSPTIDGKRKVLYVTTGDNYSDPPTATSDAFLALDLDSGKLLWSRQMTPLDAFTNACVLSDKSNCPDANGPDFDFGSSPILVELSNGRRALIAGQKSGVVHAIDPDKNGEIRWQIRIGKGGTLGGIEWGSAADGSKVYVALSDLHGARMPNGLINEVDPKLGGGMFALTIEKGERAWYTPPPGCGEKKRCSPAQSAAVSAIVGAAFSGSVDGHLRAYSTANGSILWDFDTVRAYKTVNGVEARGGSLDVGGPAIAGGMLFVNSGYVIWGGMPGNVLLAFSIEGK